MPTTMWSGCSGDKSTVYWPCKPKDRKGFGIGIGGYRLCFDGRAPRNSKPDQSNAIEDWKKQQEATQNNEGQGLYTQEEEFQDLELADVPDIETSEPTGGSGPYISDTCLVNCGDPADGQDDSDTLPADTDCLVGDRGCGETEDSSDGSVTIPLLPCTEGQIADLETYSCKEKCPVTFGYLHVNAFGEGVALGLNRVVNTDNFRDAAGAILGDTSCGTGKIFTDDQVNVLSIIPQTRDYIKADGTVGQSTYYPVEFTNCNGNQPKNEDYDPDKPCADCNGGNPFNIPMEIMGTVNNPTTGGDFGENVRGTGKHHKGADYGAPTGTYIFASNAGKVVKVVSDHPDDAKNNADYQVGGQFDWDKYVKKRKVAGDDANPGGNRVIVEYSRNGVTFTQNYMHMEHDSNNHLSVGDVVNVGDLLGKVGLTGNAQTISEANAHLHMQVVDTSLPATGNLKNRVDPNNHIYGNIDYATDEDTNPCNNN